MFDNYTLVNCDISDRLPVRVPLDLSLPVMHSVHVPQLDLHALADAVRQRRERLGFTQGHLASLGGPAVVTVGQIEKAMVSQPSAGTLRKLDTALSWQPGSAARVLHGGEAEPISDGSDVDVRRVTGAIRDDLSLRPDARDILVSLYQMLRTLPDLEGAESDRRMAERVGQLAAEVLPPARHSGEG